MTDRLQSYLDEIGRYLPDDRERGEILAEIRSLILEKAEREHGGASDADVEAAIASYGSPRRVAERWFEAQPIIAPSLRRYMVRYTALLFTFHVLLIAVAALSGTTFSMLFYIPRLAPMEALMYLPTAFFEDLGIVTLILYFVTRSRKDVRLPWPAFADAVEPDRAKAAPKWIESLLDRVLGVIITAAVFKIALSVYLDHGAVFFRSWRPFRPFFAPGPGRFYSLALLVLLAIGLAEQVARLATRSGWVAIMKDLLSLVVLGIVLARPFPDLFDPAVAAWPFAAGLRKGLTVLVAVIAIVTAADLVKNIVVLERRRYADGRRAGSGPEAKA